jgi:single-stranded DNA-specific DHH superfamily exonuclease
VGDVNQERAKDILSLAPFGIGTEKPTFVFYNVIPEKITRFGKGQEHLSLNIRDGGKTAKAISFFTPPDKFGEALIEGKPTNLVATIELSYFNPYRPETRLRIVDFFS